MPEREQPLPEQSQPTMSRSELAALEARNETAASESVETQRREISGIMDSWNTPIDPDARAAGKAARDKGIREIGVAPGPLPLDVSIDDQIIAGRRDHLARNAEISRLEQAVSRTGGEPEAAAAKNAAIARAAGVDTDPARAQAARAQVEALYVAAPPAETTTTLPTEYTPRHDAGYSSLHAAPEPASAAEETTNQPPARRSLKEAITRRWKGPGNHAR